jgi:hypothetical protein
MKWVFKRGAAPLFYLPLSFKERGIKGVRWKVTSPPKAR